MFDTVNINNVINVVMTHSRSKTTTEEKCKKEAVAFTSKESVIRENE